MVDAVSNLGLMGATLTLTSRDAPGRMLIRRLTTAADGAFELTALPTAVFLIVESKGYAVEEVFLHGEPGRFRIDGVPKGKVLVMAEITPSDLPFFMVISAWPGMLKDGLFETGRDLKVVEAGANDVVLEVTRGAALTVRIADWKALRTSSPSVVLDGGSLQKGHYVRETGGRGIKGIIDAENKTYRIEGVPDGTFSLEASYEVEGERRFEAQARASAGDIADLELKRKR